MSKYNDECDMIYNGLGLGLGLERFDYSKDRRNSYESYED